MEKASVRPEKIDSPTTNGSSSKSADAMESTSEPSTVGAIAGVAIFLAFWLEISPGGKPKLMSVALDMIV
jgi:hypothetical protein